jgi:hypothetical protein
MLMITRKAIEARWPATRTQEPAIRFRAMWNSVIVKWSGVIRETRIGTVNSGCSTTSRQWEVNASTDYSEAFTRRLLEYCSCNAGIEDHIQSSAHSILINATPPLSMFPSLSRSLLPLPREL